MNGYDLSRMFWDFSFNNPELIKPNHCAVYFFAIEHCNRLGWKDKFGFPTTMAMEAIGIKSYNTYKATLDDLVKFGFIKMIETAKNQWSANIIALSKYDKALNKALDKALIKHGTKQGESTQQSIDSIDKQETNKQLNKETIDVENEFSQKQKLKTFKQWSLEEFQQEIKKYQPQTILDRNDLLSFYDHWRELTPSGKMKFQMERSWQTDLRLKKWERNKNNFVKPQKPITEPINRSRAL